MRRKYSLPNCTLVLEGLSEATGSADPTGTRSIVSTLVNAECYIQGHPQPLTGGREFFESLVKAVSNYAQGMLSGIQAPASDNGTPDRVQIARTDNHLHRLTVTPDSEDADSSGNSDGQTPSQIDLTTVQLFDLVEAVDQFLADHLTLPDLSVKLQPVSRKSSSMDEPLVKRAAPAAIGVSSLAIAAMALFFVPIPEIRRPEEPQPEPSANESVESERSPASGSDTPPSEDSPSEASPSEASPSEEAEFPQSLETPEDITEPIQVEALTQNLYAQISDTWDNEPLSRTDLVYRVSVAEDGAVVGYKAGNQAAENYGGETPLKELLYIPIEEGSGNPESSAQFKVVFKKNGVLEVSPWDGYPEDTAQTTSQSQIQDSDQIEQLWSEIRDRLYDEWTQTPTFEDKLEYRVGVTEDGKIVEVEPINQPAFDYIFETPLEELEDLSAATTTQDGKIVPASLAEFKVVFTPGGIIEINPWHGW